LQRASGEMFGEQYIKRGLIGFSLNAFWGTKNLCVVFGHIKRPKEIPTKLYRNLGVILSIYGTDLIKTLHIVDDLRQMGVFHFLYFPWASEALYPKDIRIITKFYKKTLNEPF
jgi:hypothetical protein